MIQKQKISEHARWAEPYVREVLFPGVQAISGGKPIRNHQAAREALTAPRAAIEFVLNYAAFARAGGELAGYGPLAVDAHDACMADSSLDPRDEFERLCRAKGTGPNRKVNYRPVEGLIGCLREWRYGEEGLFGRLAKQVATTGAAAPAYFALLTECGLGEKIAAFVLRDLVCIWKIEDRIEPTHLLFLQPIDVWVHRAAEIVLDCEFEAAKVPHLFVAHRLAEACAEAGVSGVRFNQGAWWFGSQVVGRGRDPNSVVVSVPS